MDSIWLSVSLQIRCWWGLLASEGLTGKKEPLWRGLTPMASKLVLSQSYWLESSFLCLSSSRGCLSFLPAWQLVSKSHYHKRKKAEGANLLRAQKQCHFLTYQWLGSHLFKEEGTQILSLDGKSNKAFMAIDNQPQSTSTTTLTFKLLKSWLDKTNQFLMTRGI